MASEKQKSEFLGRIYRKHANRISKVLNWEIPYLNFPNMVSLKTPGDGSCLFHSILKAYNKIAIEEKIGNNPIQISDFIRSTFRELLSEYLSNTSQHGVEIYKLLNENDFDKNSSSIVELSKEYMENELKSANAVNFDYYCELLIRFCEKNIFVIDFEKQGVVLTGSINDKMRNDSWPCVVLLFVPGKTSIGHYETLGYIDTDGLHTFFSMSNVFIRCILYRAKLLNELSKIENIAEHIESVGESKFYADVKSFVPSKGILSETTNETIKNIKKKNSNNSNNLQAKSTPKLKKIQKPKSPRSIIEEDSENENEQNEDISMISYSNRERVNHIKNSILDD
jgi:hypothetical protein